MKVRAFDLRVGMQYRAVQGRYMLIERPRIVVVTQIVNLSAWWGMAFYHWAVEWEGPSLFVEEDDETERRTAMREDHFRDLEGN